MIQSLFRFFILSSCLISVITQAQPFVKTRYHLKSATHSDNYLSMSSNGSWCWFSDPRAVKFKGSKDKTYFGYIDNYGNVTIASLNHSTGNIEKRVIFDNLQVDDHDNPSILIDTLGYLYVFFNKHGGPVPLFFTRSLKPEDISEWTDIRRLELNDRNYYPGFNDTYTYTNPVMLSSENNRIYIFWRGIDNKPNYSYSDDHGESWSKGRIFILPERIYSMRRPYLKVYSDGKSKIHFAFTDGHPNMEKENSIYYMFYEGGSFHKANGQKIRELGDIPVNPSETDIVYDAKLTKQKAWIWDVAQNNYGNPVLVYAKFPSDSAHIYCYAVWNVSGWNNYDLVNSGKWFPQTLPGTVETEPNYSGGLNIDKENPNIVYLSVNRDGVFEIEKWMNKGRKWIVEAVTHGSVRNNVRPFAVRNAEADDPLQVLWMSNSYYYHYNRRSGDLSGFLSSLKANLINNKGSEQ